ncbi:hypothetical protein OSTOST_17650 [Ostertagia ostertagi]
MAPRIYCDRLLKSSGFFYEYIFESHYVFTRSEQRIIWDRTRPNCFQSMPRAAGNNRIALLSCSMSAALVANFLFGSILNILTTSFVALTFCYIFASGVVMQVIFGNVNKKIRDTNVLESERLPESEPKGFGVNFGMRRTFDFKSEP